MGHFSFKMGTWMGGISKIPAAHLYPDQSWVPPPGYGPSKICANISTVLKGYLILIQRVIEYNGILIPGGYLVQKTLQGCDANMGSKISLLVYEWVDFSKVPQIWAKIGSNLWKFWKNQVILLKTDRYMNGLLFLEKLVFVWMDMDKHCETSDLKLHAHVHVGWKILLHQEKRTCICASVHA